MLNEINAKSNPTLTKSFLTYQDEIYPHMETSLVNAIRFGLTDPITYKFLVNEIFSPQFLTLTLEKIALEDKQYLVDLNMKFHNKSLFNSLCADIKKCLFDVLSLEDGKEVLESIKGNFNPLFYGDALMHYIAEKHYA